MSIPLPPEGGTIQTVPRLHGSLGTLGLFFSMLAYNAPLVVVMGIIPLMIEVGNGVGTPLVFILAGLVLAAFSDGFIRMAKALPRPGAFYSFITAGLGREVGLGAGFVMLVCYLCVAIGTIAFGGIVLGALVTDTFHGPELPWYVWSAVFWAACALLGYLKIDLSAKVTAVLLFLELLVVAIFDIAVVAKGGGPSGLSAEPFSLAHLFDGSFGIGLLLAMGMFGGFEVAVLFRDELKQPDRSIPRATYGVIATAGILYSVTSWLFIDSVGVDQVVVAVSEDPTGTMSASMQQFAGLFVNDATNVLINTSAFAVLLCAHNVAARYAFNLSADGILPKALSGVHKNHGSPHVASVAVSVLSVVVLVPVVLLDLEPYAFYGAVLGVGALGGTAVFLLSNTAVMRFIHKAGIRENVLHRLVLPIIAGLGLLVTLILTVLNFSVLTGGSAALSDWLMVFIVAVFIAGVGLAATYKRSRPEVYQRIGRQ